jgi:hypothetical protein
MQHPAVPTAISLSRMLHSPSELSQHQLFKLSDTVWLYRFTLYIAPVNIFGKTNHIWQFAYYSSTLFPTTTPTNFVSWACPGRSLDYPNHLFTTVRGYQGADTAVKCWPRGSNTTTWRPLLLVGAQLLKVRYELSQFAGT